MNTDGCGSSAEERGDGDAGGGVLDVAALTKQELADKLQELGVKTYTAVKLNNPHLRKAALSKLIKLLDEANIPFVNSKAAPKETTHFAVASLDILREGKVPKWNQGAVSDLAHLPLRDRSCSLPSGVYKVTIEKTKLGQVKRQLEEVPGVVFLRQVPSAAAGRDLLSQPVFVAFYCASAPICLNPTSDDSNLADTSSCSHDGDHNVSSFFVSRLQILNRDVSTNPCLTATFLADNALPTRVQEAKSLAAEVRRATGAKATFWVEALPAVEAWCASIVNEEWERQQQAAAEGAQAGEQMQAAAPSIGDGGGAGDDAKRGSGSRGNDAVDAEAEAEAVVERRRGLGEKLTQLERAMNNCDLDAFKTLLQDPQLLFESSLKSEHVLPCRLEKPQAGNAASRTALHTIAERGMTDFAAALVAQIQRAVEEQVLGSNQGNIGDAKAQEEEVERLTCSLILKYLLFPLRGNPPVDTRRPTQADVDDAFMTSLHLASAHGHADTLQFFLYLMCGTPYPRASNNRSLKDVACTRGAAQGDDEAKSRVLRVLQRRWYVPLNDSGPGVSSRVASEAPPEHFDVANPGSEFRAFAGPMTAGEARAFARFLRKGPNAALRGTGVLPSPATPTATDVTSLQSQFGQLLLESDETTSNGAERGEAETRGNVSAGPSRHIDAGSTASSHGGEGTGRTHSGASTTASSGSVEDITARLAATQLTADQSPATPRALQRNAPGDPDELSMLRKLEAAVTQDMWAELEDLRKADPCKSTEVRGRALARFAGVRWEEYWPFLGCMTNLACDEGFQRLDNYLASTQQPFIGGDKTCAWDVTAFVACQDHPSIEQSNSDPLYRDRLRSELSQRFPDVMKWFCKLEEEQRGVIEQPTQQSPLSRRCEERSCTPPTAAREIKLLVRHKHVVQSGERSTQHSPLSKKSMREKTLLDRHSHVVRSEHSSQQSPLSRRFHERNDTPTRGGAATPGTSSPLTRSAANTPTASSPAVARIPVTTPRRTYMSPRRRASRSAMKTNTRGSSIAALLSRHTPARVSSPVGFRKRAAWINQRSQQEDDWDETFVEAPTQPAKPRCSLPMACARINACGISRICFTHPVLSPAPPPVSGTERAE